MTMTAARRRNRRDAARTVWTTVYRLIATRFLPPGNEFGYPENVSRPTLNDCADIADKMMGIRARHTENEQLRFNLHEAYNRIESLKKQVLELELAVATQPE